MDLPYTYEILRHIAFIYFETVGDEFILMNDKAKVHYDHAVNNFLFDE